MVAEGAVCGPGLAAVGFVAIGVIAFLLFSVFGGKDSKKQPQETLSSPTIEK